MWKSEYTIGGKKVEIYLSGEPYLDFNNTIFFGYPYNFIEEFLQEDEHYCVNNLKGYWLRIEKLKDQLIVTPDMFGGFRVFYLEKNEFIYISDNYELLLQHLKKDYEIDEEEFHFWKNHRFTTGKSTFIKGLLKIDPCCSLIISSNDITKKKHFINTVRHENREAFSKLVHQDLQDTFNFLKKETNKIILLFSGGRDSYLLANYLKKKQINFIPVFFHLEITDEQSSNDWAKVKKTAELLSLNVEVITFSINELTNDLLQSIIKKQLFDRHFSVLHYLGMEKIAERYGKKVIIVNGQSSDSIFSFGPSEQSLMSYFRRQIMYYPNKQISRLGVLLLELKAKKTFSIPVSMKERLFALLDEYKYTRVIDNNLDNNYRTYLENYIEDITSDITSFESKEMLIKISSFIQGSDNQVVVNSSRFNGIKKIIMPYATPAIVYATVAHKSNEIEINKPKYVVDDILKEKFGLIYKTSFFDKFRSYFSNLLSKKANYFESTMDRNFYSAVVKVNEIESNEVKD